MLTREVLKTVTRSWDLELLRPRYDIPIAGSPERCLFRVVVEEIEGRLYILEQIDPRSLPQKHRIAHTLNLLHLRGLQTVRPYLSGRRSEFIARIPEGDWQIAPYISGVELSRPGYAVEAWRGEVLAEFLMALRAKTREGLPDYSGSRPFSLPAFIEDLMHRLQRHDPEVYRRVLAAWRHLKLGWTAAHDQTPTAFCHGDFHPLNVVWTKDGIACVIDWEFSGYKREPYDAANLIGCIGMEHPRYLTGALVISFIERLKLGQFLNPSGWDHLIDFIQALRFAWLSEWLRKSDAEMIDLECRYIQILGERRDYLKQAWGL